VELTGTDEISPAHLNARVTPARQRPRLHIGGERKRGVRGCRPTAGRVKQASVTNSIKRKHVASTVVIQAKQGIGDVIWHLPFIRAIAATTPAGIVTFLTLPSSHARELLAGEPCVAETLYYENRGSGLARTLHLVRLIALLRRLRPETIWILDRSARPALAALAAGVPNRIGLGFGRQRWFITNAGIDRQFYHDYPVEWLTALMEAMKVPLATTEPSLRLQPTLSTAIAQRYAVRPRPWIVLGIGSSAPDKDWPMERWGEFIAGLRHRTPGTVFLIGGPHYAARAERLAESAGAPMVNACDLTVMEATALLQKADLFVGSDSGPMNLAAAVGTPAFGLFGRTRVLTYSRFIHAIQPDDGRAPMPNGMQRISADAVLARIEPYLCAQSAVSMNKPK
jgi:heptosyltransferase-2